MKVSQKKLAPCRIKILFEIDWEEFSPYFEKALSKSIQHLEVPGFRRGTVPREIAKKYLNEEAIMAEAAETAAKEKYLEYILKNNLNIISRPEIRITKLAKNNPFCFEAEADILAEIKLPDYKKIAAKTKKRKNIPPTEEEIEETLKWLRQSRAEFKDSQEPVQKGKFIEIEYQGQGWENNKLFRDSFICGEGHFIAGFEENLIGMKVNEEKEFELKLPADYKNKNLAGQNIRFRVKLKKVQEICLPELNDEFARNLGHFENLTALRQSITEGISKEKEVQESQRVRKEILENISREVEFNLPASLIEREEEYLLEELKEMLSQSSSQEREENKNKIETILGKSEEEIKELLKPEAEKRIKEMLLLKEIGKKEKIEATEEEVIAAVNNFLKKIPDLKSAEKLDPQQLKDYYKEAVFNEKVWQLLENLAGIEE